MLPTSNVFLEIDVDNKRGRIVDDSDYASEDIVLSAVGARGLGVVTYGSGDTTQVVFNGSSTSNPLVNLASSTNGQWFNLPLDVNGNILNGTYSFTYNLRFAGSASVDAVTAPSTAVLEFTDAGRVLQAGDSIIFTGNTQGANNGTFTIATATFNVGADNSTITVTQTTLVNEASPTGTYTYDVVRTNFASFSDIYTGCDEVKPKVTTTIDCDSTQFGTIIFKDDTNLEGQTLVSRALTGFYPNGLNPAPATESVTTSQSSLTFSELAVGTWTYVLILNLSVTQSGGLVYGYTLRDTNEVKVTCVGALCSITPCLENLSTAIMNTYKTGASNLIPVLTTVNTLINLANAYKECGEDEKYKQTVQEIHDVLDSSGCTCGCDEGQDVPYWVDNANLNAPSAFLQLQNQVDLLEEEFDEFVEQTDDNFEDVYNQLGFINTNIGALSLVIQDNAAALAAYTLLISNLNTFSTSIQDFLLQENLIQSLIGQLNPNSPEFEDDVEQIENLIADLEVDYVNLVSSLDDINAEFIAFNTNYPEYTAFTTAAITYYDNATTDLASIQTNIDALQSLLASITPTTYAEDILDLQSNIEALWSSLNTVIISINTIGYVLTTVQNSLIELQNQISVLNEQVNNIQFPPPLENQSKVQPLGVAVGAGLLTIGVPDKYTTKGGYFKVIVKGKDDTDAGCEIKISNVETSYELFAAEVGIESYEIEFVVIPNLQTVPITFSIGGGTDIDSEYKPYLVQNINSTTEIVYAQGFNLRIESNSISNVFSSIEIYGYDTTY